MSKWIVYYIIHGMTSKQKEKMKLKKKSYKNPYKKSCWSVWIRAFFKYFIQHFYSSVLQTRSRLHCFDLPGCTQFESMMFAAISFYRHFLWHFLIICNKYNVHRSTSLSWFDFHRVCKFQLYFSYLLSLGNTKAA